MSRFLALACCCAGFALAAEQPAVEHTAAEQQLFDLVNEARASEKLPPLKISQTLIRVARGHAENMARQKMRSHVLDGKNVDARADAAGYDFDDISENLATNDQLNMKEVLDIWMKSATHRPNILNPKFEEAGVGIMRDGDKGLWYIAEVYGKPHRPE